jgi:hypothetical protein
VPVKRGVVALENACEKAKPFWERESYLDSFGYEPDYEDYEDHPYNIMGAQPGQRYG